jgi:hypothetical protein
MTRPRYYGRGSRYNEYETTIRDTVQERVQAADGVKYFRPYAYARSQPEGDHGTVQRIAVFGDETLHLHGRHYDDPPTPYMSAAIILSRQYTHDTTASEFRRSIDVRLAAAPRSGYLTLQAEASVRRGLFDQEAQEMSWETDHTLRFTQRVEEYPVLQAAAGHIGEMVFNPALTQLEAWNLVVPEHQRMAYAIGSVLEAQ